MIAAMIFGILMILLVLVDGFEAMILPRRVGRKFRLTMLLYRTLWPAWRAIARPIVNNKQRHTFLSIFGPFSLLLLFALWAMVLILGFGLLSWSLGTKLQTPNNSEVDVFTYLYLSGVTFFTLGFGDVTPLNTLGRVVIVSESGIGFGFLAVVIGYMPVLYQAFSKREVSISLLDARAGSPPTAAEILMRFARGSSMEKLDPFLAEW
ncbi:MAG TPA: potassium channel family protein, partial [Bryobacteraceae bacterium]